MTYLLTTEDLLSALRISRKTLDKHIAAGLLPAPMRMGRRRYWQQDAVDAALANRKGDADSRESRDRENAHV